ncbi:MAG TPA: substrate-binding domain-containing protein, partial [Mycobacterium sp.]
MHRRRSLVRRGLVPLALLAASSLLLTACQSGGEASPAGEGGGGDEVAVTLITKTSTNPFFIAMQKGAEEAGKANNVSITTAAGKEDGDETTQIAAIEAAVARGDQGILITPATDGVNPAIEAARQAGLYVIALDTPPNPPDTVDITFATDNFKAGELIGQWAAKTMNGQKA